MSIKITDPSLFKVWVDGSAAQKPEQSLLLGAGWVVMRNGALVLAGSVKIKDAPPTTNYSLFAEIRAATLALKGLPYDSTVELFSDHGHVVDFINAPHVSRRSTRKNPEIVPAFNQLRNAIKLHERVVAISASTTTSDFCKAAHGLAVEASGAKKKFYFAPMSALPQLSA